jgi:hypothetical protein
VGILSRPEDRRVFVRKPIDQIPRFGPVRIAAEKVDVLNASQGGLLIESPMRLPPGSENAVELSLAEAPRRVRGRIVRCEVRALAPEGLRYRMAIAFNAPVVEIDATDGRPTQAMASSPDSVSTFAGDAMAVVPLDPALAANEW